VTCCLQQICTIMFNIDTPYIHDTAFLMSLTHAQETGTRNLVQVVLYKKLARVSVNLVQLFSGTSFLHAMAHSSIPGQKLLDTRLKSCNVIGLRVVIVFVVISFRLFFVTYLFSFTRNLKMEWNLNETGVATDCSQNDVCVCSFGCRLQFPPLYLHKITCTSLFVFLERVSPALYNQGLCSVSRE